MQRSLRQISSALRSQNFPREQRNQVPRRQLRITTLANDEPDPSADWFHDWSTEHNAQLTCHPTTSEAQDAVKLKWVYDKMQGNLFEYKSDDRGNLVLIEVISSQRNVFT